ncbi:MAG: hypothetical protein Q4B67_03905 [Eubacteriales bacterium]|nr:hypothetical protein [Eubacteriales bacterium]
MTLSLTGCGKGGVKQTFTDGTTVQIEYKSAAILQRAPVFSLKDYDVCMSFNGTLWYRASIIDKKTADWIAGGRIIAESSNMLVYEGREHAICDYAYVLKLDGTDEAFILFYTDQSPLEHTYGNDFTEAISYYVETKASGKNSRIVTVPDTEWRSVGN